MRWLYGREVVLRDTRFLYETEKAYQVERPDDGVFWVPKSQVKARDGDTFVVTMWWAAKRGLIETDEMHSPEELSDWAWAIDAGSP